MGDILKLLEDEKIQIDFTMLWEEADKAAKKIISKSGTRGDVEDVRSDLMVKVLEDQPRFENYISTNSFMSPSERRAKLGVSLYRIGIKAFYQEDPWHYRIDYSLKEVSQDFSEAGLEDSYRGLENSYAFQTRSMSQKDFTRLLPLINEDKIAPEDQHKIAMLREAVRACTPEQQAVIALKAQGLRYKRIAEILGISPNTARKRFERSHLRQRTYI